MKSVLSNTNKKGQIVLPKEYRDAVGITESTPLTFQLAGRGILVLPVTTILTGNYSQETTHEILRRTQGGWGKPSEEEIKKQKQLDKAERENAELTKHSW